jgi:hypothetical protein
VKEREKFYSIVNQSDIKTFVSALEKKFPIKFYLQEGVTLPHKNFNRFLSVSPPTALSFFQNFVNN